MYLHKNQKNLVKGRNKLISKIRKLINTIWNWDQGNNLKWRISSYFHSSLLRGQISNSAGQSFTLNTQYPQMLQSWKKYHPYIILKIEETHNLRFFPWPEICCNNKKGIGKKRNLLKKVIYWQLKIIIKHLTKKILYFMYLY